MTVTEIAPKQKDVHAHEPAEPMLHLRDPDNEPFSFCGIKLGEKRYLLKPADCVVCQDLAEVRRKKDKKI